ncbi:MAG: AMP-binding protein, partial [Rhodocyclaceae bacterium]|nr:AMP-binding protein [Rhodocyclaceae bacterium]
MSYPVASAPLWQPSAERIAGTQLTAFAKEAAARWGRSLPDYAALHAWSIAHPEEFWVSVWDFGGVIGERGDVVVENGDRMPGARWFPQARLNFARNLLRSRDDGLALVFWGEDKLIRRMDRGDLYRRVARLAAAMKADGVKAGDRIAAYMPNMPETLVTMLAAASIGAIFTSASPDFGVQGVIDRFGQVEPKLLFVADGYYYNGKTLDSLEKVAEIADRLPTVEKVIVARYVKGEGHDLSRIRGGVMLRDYVDPHRWQTEIDFAELPFDHP